MRSRNSDDLVATWIVTIYDWIEQYMDDHGIAPSMDEIASGVYLSRAQTTRYMDILQARGCLDRLDRIPRSIRLIKRPARSAGRLSTDQEEVDKPHE